MRTASDTRREAMTVCMLVTVVGLVFLGSAWLRWRSHETFLKGDCYYYRAAVQSLLEDRDLALGNNVPTYAHFGGDLALGRDGALVPKHPVFMSLVSLPFYAAAGTPGLLVFNLLQSLGVVVLIYVLGRQFFSPAISCATSLAYATTTLFIDYAYNYSPDVFSTVFVLGALAAVFRSRFIPGVVLTGLSLFAKLTNVLSAIVLLAYVATAQIARLRAGSGDRRAIGEVLRSLSLLTVAFLLSLGPLLAANQVLYGSALVTGYQRTAISTGRPGEAELVTHVSKFNQPLLPGVRNLLFDREHGLIPTNPILVTSLLGLFVSCGRVSTGKQAVLLLICLGQLLLFGKFDDWQASHFSNRYLMTTVAVCSVYSAALFEWARNAVSRVG